MRGRPLAGVDTFAKEAIAGLQTPTPLSEAFFSRKNLNTIQDEIRYRVHISSGKKYTIDRQDDDAVKVRMRGVYLLWAQHRVGDLPAELAELNERVISDAVREVLSAVEHFIRYRHDIALYPLPLERPTDPSMRGTKGTYTASNVKFF